MEMSSAANDVEISVGRLSQIATSDTIIEMQKQDHITAVRRQHQMQRQQTVLEWNTIEYHISTDDTMG